MLSGIMLWVSWSNHQSSKEFLQAEKVKTTATIKKVDGQKAYYFSAIAYGVAGSDPGVRDIGKDGETVTIYYQKDKPHVVYRSPHPKDLWISWVGPLGWSLFFLLFFGYTFHSNFAPLTFDEFRKTILKRTLRSLI